MVRVPTWEVGDPTSISHAPVTLSLFIRRGTASPGDIEGAPIRIFNTAVIKAPPWLKFGGDSCSNSFVSAAREGGIEP